MRIMIIGRPGSGKSTFAFSLAQKLNLPLHHLDKHFFTAHWRERDYQEFLAIQQKMVGQNSWIIDGCSIRSLEMRYARADVCIYLKYPRLLCLYRLFKRMFNKNPAIDDRAQGCRETISWKLMKYLWTFEYRKNKMLIRKLAELGAQYPGVKFYTITNDQELSKFIEQLMLSTKF